MLTAKNGRGPKKNFPSMPEIIWSKRTLQEAPSYPEKKSDRYDHTPSANPDQDQGHLDPKVPRNREVKVLRTLLLHYLGTLLLHWPGISEPQYTDTWRVLLPRSSKMRGTRIPRSLLEPVYQAMKDKDGRKTIKEEMDWYTKEPKSCYRKDGIWQHLNRRKVNYSCHL